MKLYKAGIILQILYCIPCLIVPVCMLSYTWLYPSEAAKLCFTTGGALTLISTVNPLGLAGTILRWIGCFSTDLRKQWKTLARTLLSPVLVVLMWMMAVCFFIGISGGV